ncbi:MAG: hypothetical protein FWE41_01605 [Coriobacteriia bacterium]|nr:hypothetical protein [Coriobacteriia bacterium]
MRKIGASILQVALIAGALAGGWLGYAYINQASAGTGEGVLWVLTIILITVIAAVIGTGFNIIAHEAGHLVGGLLTGYRFISFNVLTLTIMKENGKLVRKKYRLAGTGGGCLLAPPDMKDGSFPYKLYISGGFLVNFVLAALCFGLFFGLASTAELWARAFLIAAIAGAFLGVTNLIPHKQVLPSDGYFLFNLGSEKNAVLRRSFWTVFHIQALVAGGTRPRDISPDLFDWVDPHDVDNLFDLMIAAKRYEYLMDKQELDEARELMRILCKQLHDVPDMIAQSLRLELLFHELIAECRPEKIDRLYDKHLRSFTKSAHREMSVQRTLYAYSLLFLNDAAKAEEHLKLFEQACTETIQPSLAPGEQELITLIDTLPVILSEAKDPVSNSPTLFS